MVKTNWAWLTCSRMCVSSHSANSRTRFCWQEGQKSLICCAQHIRLYAERMNMLSTGASPLVSLWLFKALRSRPAQFTSHILSSQTTFLETSFTQFQGGCHAGVLHR